MITRDELFSIVSIFQENTFRYTAASDKLLHPCGQREWINLLKERSETTRAIFAQNEKWLARLYEEIEDMDLQKAYVFYDALMDIMYDQFVETDYPLMIRITEKITPFFEESRDYNRTVRLYALLIVMNMEYYVREMGAKSCEAEMFALVNKFLGFKDIYSEITDKQSRLRIYRTYANFIGPLTDMYDIPCETVIEWHDDVMRLWRDDTLYPEDKNDESFMSELQWLEGCFSDYCFTWLLHHINEKESSDYILCKRNMEQLVQASADVDSDLTLLRNKLMLDYMDGKYTDSELTGIIIEKLSALPEIGEDKQGNENVIILDSAAMTATFFFEVIRFADYDETIKRKQSEKVLKIFLYKIRKLPGNAYSEYVNDVYSDFVQLSLRYFGSFEEKISILERLIISRQPLTFVHSYMVEKLAVGIAESIIEKRPDFFVGVPGYNSADDVKNNKDGLLLFIGRCGALHDIGKCRIASIINLQTRKLSDKEFRCIRRHPTLGAGVFENDSDFAPYIHIILGHHRTYDGKAGYPEDFDILSSPYKPVIDLISVCDSLDAATDSYGRNYNKAKVFDTVLEEFKAGAGTRYNPVIVEILEGDPNLRNMLSRMATSDGRAEAYYTAYRKCQEYAEFNTEHD